MAVTVKQRLHNPSKESIAEIDRRLRPRIQTRLSLKTPLDSEARLVNISETGVCFSTCHGILASESLIKIGFASGFVEASIKVEWTKSSGTNGGVLQGASFKDISKAVLATVRKHVFLEPFRAIAKDIKDEHVSGDVLAFASDVENYLHAIANLEKRLAQKTIDAETLQEQINSLNDAIVTKGEALKEKVDSKLIFNRIKHEFRNLVAPWAFKSQIMKRGFDKPKGYPGDYRTLEVIYDFETFSSENDMGLYFDRYFLQNPYADAVRNRKYVLREILREMLYRSQGQIKVLDLASGSCREMRELFSTKDEGLLKKEVLFSCIDWDDDALRFSKNALSHLPKNVRFDFIKEDILNFTKNADFFRDSGRYDLIYSIGLADYLPDRVLKNMIKNSFEGLNPGGKFIIAHKDREIAFSHLPPEWFCDWVFIPRNENEMLDIVRQAGLDKFISKTQRDETKQIFFIALVKE